MLVAAALVAVGGIVWLKQKVADAVGTPEEMAAHVQQVEALDQKYPSRLPTEGERLESERVEAYLAIRERLSPIHAEIEAASRALERPAKDAGIRAGLEAIDKTGDLVRRLRKGFAEAADARQMSPAEFSALSRIVYGAYWQSRAEARVGERKVIERTMAQIDQRLASGSLTERERALAQEQRATLAAQLAGIPVDEGEKPRATTILGANVTLLDKYRPRIERLAMPGLEAFLFGDRYDPKPPSVEAEGH